jgi:hypothetical protein
MHLVHRRHLPDAMAVTFIAAMLAIVLTLALATPLNELASAPAPTRAGSPAALHMSTSRPSWNMRPFAPLLTAPPPVPWVPAHR